MTEIEGRYFNHPGSQGDGLTLCDGNSYRIKNCLFDMSANSLEDIDEALGITWGSSAVVENCVFRGAGKLVLCGSGDADRKADEHGKKVVFMNCIFENFGRRGPEVQDGMMVELNNCLIRDWGEPSRFTVRSFGAWAHGKGSHIRALSTIFMQDSLFTRNFLADMIGHIGQAWNDRGIKGILSRDAWVPGRARALTASDGGCIDAWNCYFNKWWLMGNCQPCLLMDEQEAEERIVALEIMKEQLLHRFGLWGD